MDKHNNCPLSSSFHCGHSRTNHSVTFRPLVLHLCLVCTEQEKVSFAPSSMPNSPPKPLFPSPDNGGASLEQGFAPDLQGPRVSVNPYTLSARINVADLQTLWEARASVLEQSQHAEPDRRQSVGLATGAAHKDCGAITLCFRALAPTT